MTLTRTSEPKRSIDKLIVEGRKPIVEGRKAWARKAIKGGESFIFPSMSPDFKRLDEEGVRNDVRRAIDQGLCSVLPAQVGLDRDTGRRFAEIVADEAAGRIGHVAFLHSGGWERVADTVVHSESIGCTHALIMVDATLPSQDEIYRQMLSVIDNTSMGIVLYAAPKASLRALDPTGVPLDAFDRLADHPNVVGIKLTQIIPSASALAVAERLADRLLIGPVHFELLLMLALKFPIQWSGQWALDTLQTPEQPFVTDFLDLVGAGKHAEALAQYWRFEPAASAFYNLQGPHLAAGGHPCLHIKYLQWLTGGNGGLIAADHENSHFPALDADTRKRCRAALAGVGLQLVDRPEEAFVVGNAAYDRGVRLKDLSATPQYLA